MMDFLSDYIEQLHSDIRSRINSMQNDCLQELAGCASVMSCPSCGSKLDLCDNMPMYFCPYCGEALQNGNGDVLACALKPLYKLPHYQLLESETKAKIGTFEKIYEQLYQYETGRPMIEKKGACEFDKLDYAPLINPLASSLEIEFGASVGALLAKAYGRDYIVRMPKKNIVMGKISSLREYQFCIEYDCSCKNVVREAGFCMDSQCASLFRSIVSVRNTASHGEPVDKDTFYKFYDCIYPFFEIYVPQLIEIKKFV